MRDPGDDPVRMGSGRTSSVRTTLVPLCALWLLAGSASSLYAQVDRGPARSNHPSEAPPPDTAAARVPRLLLDADLRARTVTVVALTPDGVTVRDVSGGSPVTVRRAEVLAIVPVLGDAAEGPGAPTDSAVGTLQRTDSGVLPGQLSSDEAGEEKIAWESRLWGRVTMPLDQVAWLRLRGPDVAPAPAEQDTLTLTNGDRAEGFVSRVGPVFTVERDGKKTDIPVERVAALRLANPPLPASGVWVWMHDGAAAAVNSISITPAGGLTLAGAGGLSASSSAPELRAVLFKAEALRPLAMLDPIVVPAPGRRWTPAPVVGDVRDAALFAADIELPGPMAVEWNLPEGARRFAGIAELPARCRLWGDCTVAITAGGKRLWEARLKGDSPRAEFNVDVAAGSGPLRITLDQGAGGPVQDRVIIRRGVFALTPMGGKQ